MKIKPHQKMRSLHLMKQLELIFFVPEVYGTQIDAEKLIAKAGEAVKSMRTECEVTEDDLIKPTVSAVDPRSISALQTVEKLYPNEVTLTLNGSVNAATITKGYYC